METIKVREHIRNKIIETEIELRKLKSIWYKIDITKPNITKNKLQEIINKESASIENLGDFIR